jgi:hypothetical protein
MADSPGSRRGPDREQLPGRALTIERNSDHSMPQTASRPRRSAQRSQAAAVAHDRGPAGLDAPPLSPVALGMAARPGDKANGLVRRLTQSAQSTDLRTYEPLSSRVEMYSVVQSSPVAPTTLFDCAT